MSEDIRTRQGRRKKKEDNKVPNSRKKLYKKIAIVIACMFGIILIAGGITVFSIMKDAPKLDPDKLTLAQNPQIFDQNGEMFTTLSAIENRQLASIKDIPQLVEDAFISVEDVRFRKHPGVDIRRMFGALKANITGGFGAEGASTITQQVVKNLFLSTDKLLTRKLQEQYMAIKLEQQYSKDQILEMYLNAIYFSEGAYGVVEAADLYFSKTLDQLTIEDAALLAGIPQRPNYFNPFTNPEAAEQRRNIVITLMERHGKITSSEAKAAKAVSVQSQLNRSDKEDYPYRSFLDQVLKEVEAIEGISSTDIYTGGLKIYTTLDQEAQKFTDEVLQSDQYINYPDEDFQAGVAVIDTKTGEIKAIGGGRQKSDVKRGFSWATDAYRQPGSTIKPILDYGPVIEHLKWSTYHQIKDEPYQYSTGTPVRNFNNKYSGDVTMRYALQKSLNIPALKAFHAVGKEKAAQFGKGLGIPLNTIQESYALGGFTTGISPLQLAGAFAAFGNDGLYNEPHAVRKVVFPNGKEIDLTKKPFVAMSDYTAFMITDMLKTAVGPNGTGNSARVEGVPMAGKTGTSNFSEDEKKRYNIGNGAKDSWFSGYSTEFTIAVWTGYDTPDKGYIKYDGRQNIAKQIFKHIMTEISKGKTATDFKQPSSVVRVGIERGSGLLPSDLTPKEEIIYEYFVKGTEPKEVSDQFIKPLVPSMFNSAYDERTDQIIVSWDFPSEQLSNYTFELQMSVNQGEFRILTTTGDMQYIVMNPESNATYQFKLTAILNQNEEKRSDPLAASVKVPDKSPPPAQEEAPPPNQIPDPVDDLELEEPQTEQNDEGNQENETP